jgi:RNA polymerase sigma factor (TIGR02999 family)
MRQGPVTQLLTRYRTGDAQAYDELLRIVYPEIRAMAQRRARGSAELGASTLVSETFLKFLSSDSVQPGDRAQFFGLMATIMRQVIIDEARAVGRLKRAGRAVTLDEEVVEDDSAERAQFLIQVDEIVTRLEGTDPEICRVFELRFFAGLTTQETADALGKSKRTVERLWSSSREIIRSMLR